ncbi:hypothetical protein [Nocardia abscessus]|uniref:hypothetical protein n=1 Tax=Nocardia abscessus TaxID=120957 RepID=UPI00245771AE|nr:hypothetical protein [Nocardia abscessus]
MNLPITQTDTDVLATRTVVLAALASVIKETADEHRRELDKRMPRGSKLTSMDPRDETATLGTVNQSNPAPTAVITNRDEFERWCRVTFGDQVEQWLEFGPPEEVGAVLAEHAPHLVTVHQSLPGEVVERALQRAAKEHVPGTERRVTRPKLSVYLTDYARTVVRELLASTPLLPELEAGRGE